MKYRIKQQIENDGVWYYPQKKKWYGWEGKIGARDIDVAKEMIDSWIEGKDKYKRVQIIKYPEIKTVQDY